jgi:histidinol phosphatase-like PHP family hydrolase
MSSLIPSWQPADCHAHSTFSDGALTIPQLIERAASLSVYPGVADHISYDVRQTIDSVASVAAYLDELERHDMLRGGEFCYHDSLWRELPEEIVRRFTHRVGSIHAVRLPNGTMVRAFSRRLPSDLLVDVYMNAHIGYLEEFAREMAVDVLAHPTLIAFPFRTFDIDTLWTEERETRLVDALFAADIAFEISNRYTPHERIVRRAVDRGVRISLGSDGHTFEQVADLSRPLTTARSLGVRDEDIYDPRRHGSKSGHFAR